MPAQNFAYAEFARFHPELGVIVRYPLERKPRKFIIRGKHSVGS